MTVVVDTSALTAVLLGEEDAELYLRELARNAGDLAVSAATLVETRIVLERRTTVEALADLNRLLHDLQIRVEPFDDQQAGAAHAGWRRFGKGRHEAALNLGDCYSYALTKQTGGRLLFKGEDFSKTDLPSAL
ncbi:type II toxin-antitoxin system VapC family toxin [Nesterenkonia muleiensis]|uniref:type II toxin-antitoxin system VapC family toxin n=1 Tax=Nesterenkonia muleiensis TaxID=2282648 RepID=UPI000E745A1C|nr:type II toxin-antitoxin system VapC family toxin [Nesterenkonia muleiensis]